MDFNNNIYLPYCVKQMYNRLKTHKYLAQVNWIQFD